jgi:hypothetical protein
MVCPRSFTPTPARSSILNYQGAIDTDIWILGDNEESDRHRLEKPPLDDTGKRRKTLLKMSSKNGSIRANIVSTYITRLPQPPGSSG